MVNLPYTPKKRGEMRSERVREMASDWNISRPTGLVGAQEAGTPGARNSVSENVVGMDGYKSDGSDGESAY